MATGAGGGPAIFPLQAVFYGQIRSFGARISPLTGVEPPQPVRLGLMAAGADTATWSSSGGIATPACPDMKTMALALEVAAASPFSLLQAPDLAIGGREA
ncbi:unnamed protein product [Urochloa humidicola]